MSCMLFFHFLLLIISMTLLLLGISTSNWLVYTNKNTPDIIKEYSNGILISCERLHSRNNTNQYVSTSNSSYDVHRCFNHFLKWCNASINGPEVSDYQKVLIGTSFGCVFFSIISLLLTQLINTGEASFDKIHLSKCIIDCLFITNILTVIFALMTLTFFIIFEQLQKLQSYGYSFWSFVLATCCLFLCCIVLGVFRIDVEFEFRRYRQESIATLC